MECPPEVMLQMSSNREDDAGNRAKKRIDIFYTLDCVGSIAEFQAAFQSFIAMEMEAFKTWKLD
jgi:hypothetical protein